MSDSDPNSKSVDDLVAEFRILYEQAEEIRRKMEDVSRQMEETARKQPKPAAENPKTVT